jgi:hypothetical protein
VLATAPPNATAAVTNAALIQIFIRFPLVMSQRVSNAYFPLRFPRQSDAVNKSSLLPQMRPAHTRS